MKSLQRTQAGSIVRSALFVTAAVGVMGLSYGAVSVEYGLPWWIPVLLSVLVVAGASELMFVAIIAAGASPWLAAAAGLLVNARHLPFGFQAAPLLGSGARCLAGAHVVNDESISFVLAGQTHAARRLGFWVSGIGVVVIWPLSTALGTRLGTVLGDVRTWGLDAVFPAVVLGLVLPKVRDGGVPMIAAVAAGAALTVGTAGILPSGLPELLSIAAVVLARPWRVPAPSAQEVAA